MFQNIVVFHYEKKPSKLTTLMSDASKSARDILNKSKDIAIEKIDQNDNGAIDIEDAVHIAGTVGNAIKSGTRSIIKNAEEAAHTLEVKCLQPVFPDDMNDCEFHMSRLIRVVERGGIRNEREVCNGSIGYISNYKGLEVVNIYEDSVDFFGIGLYPDNDSEFYYINPVDRNQYISLDEYFGYLKVVRINELQQIAQDLGAKHFRVTYKEEKKQLTDKKMKSKAKVKAAQSVEFDYEKQEKQYGNVEISADMSFAGHSPTKPHLKYLNNDISIQNLIDMRMNEDNPFLHQTIMIKLSKSSGIKENEAAKIDAMLKGLKCSGNTTLSSEVQDENRRYLEYEIDF